MYVVVVCSKMQQGKAGKLGVCVAAAPTTHSCMTSWRLLGQLSVVVAGGMRATVPAAIQAGGY